MRPELLPSCNKRAMTREQDRATTWLALEENGLWAVSKSRKSKRLSQRLQKEWACLGHGLTEHVKGTSDPSQHCEGRCKCSRA